MNDTLRKVVLVSPSWPPGALANGIVTYVKYIKAGIECWGIQTTIATANLRSDDDDVVSLHGAATQNGSIARLFTRACRRLFTQSTNHLASTLDAVVALRKLERDWQFDLLETEESFGLARWITKTIKAPVVVRLHGPWFVNGPVNNVPRDSKYQARVVAEGKAIAEAAGVSSPNLDLLERVRSFYGLRLRHAVVIPNPGPETSIETTWNWEATEKGNVLFIGRFDLHKGGDIAISAFTLLAQRMPSLVLTIVGPDRGVLDDSGRRWSCTDYVAAKVPSGIQHRIRFLGEVKPDDLAQLRLRASVVISASRYENFAMAMLEAMSQGCPVVCPNVGGYPEMIKDGVSGLLYPAGDAARLAEGIEKVVNSPARAVELGRHALEHYRGSYLPGTIAAQTLDFYREVMRRHRDHRRTAAECND